MNRRTPHNGEKRILFFAMGNTPNNNPHAQENFSENVEDMYSMETGEGGTMDLYDKHYQGKVDALSTEIESHIANIDTCNFDKSEPLTAKKEYWSGYYTELGDWMQGFRNEKLMAREQFDRGMDYAEKVIANLDDIADKAESLATTGPTEKRKTYSEKMAEHFEKDALDKKEVAGQVSSEDNMYILDVPQNWLVHSDAVLEARPNETGNAANERAVAAGRNRVYLRNDITEFQVNTSEGLRVVDVDNTDVLHPVFRLRDLERKEVLENGSESVKTAVDAVITVETAEGEPKPTIHIEIDEENNEAHENTEELAEKDPVADNNITEASIEAIPSDDLTVTVDENGNTVKMDLENADVNLPIQASAIIDNALTKSLDIGKEETTITLDSGADEIIIETIDDRDQVLLDQTVDSLIKADVAKVEQKDGKIIIKDAKEKADDVVKHVRKMAKTDRSVAKEFFPGVELPDEQKIVTEAEAKAIDEQINIDNKYLAYDGLQRLLIGSAPYNRNHDDVKEPSDIGVKLVKRLYSDKTGDVYLSGWNLTENEDWGVDNKMTSGIVELIKKDPEAALIKIRNIEYSNSYAPSTKKFLDKAHQEYSKYSMEKALTYEELKDSKHVKSVMGHVKQIGDSVRAGSGGDFVEKQIAIGNTILENFSSLASRAGLGLALEESMLPAMSKDGKTLYRFSYDSKTNVMSYTKYDVDAGGVLHKEGYHKEQEGVKAKEAQDNKPIDPEFAPDDNSSALTKAFRTAMENIDSDSQAYDESMINALSVTMNADGKYDLAWNIQVGDAPRYPAIQGIMEHGGVYENGAFVYKNAVESELQYFIDNIK